MACDTHVSFAGGALSRKLLHPAVGIWMLREQTNFRLYDYPQDGKLPADDIRASEIAFMPGVVSLMERADREALSVRDCGILVVASRSHGSFVGTPALLVDVEMVEHV